MYKCPQCEGLKYITIGMMEKYDNIEQECPTCSGVGLVSTRYYMQRMRLLDEYIDELQLAVNTLQGKHAG